MNHECLTVMGTMGVGKSTVSELLAKELHFHLMDEQFQKNPYLDDYYDDPSRWAFHSQVSCLTLKYQQTVEAAVLRKRKPVLQDTPIHQDRLYAVAQHMLGNMNDEEWKLYEKLYDVFTEKIDVLPNLLIYLSAPLPVILQRIADRDRACERKVDPSYVELLDLLNHEWLVKNQTVPVLMVETDGLDVVHSPSAQRQLVNQVRGRL